MEFKALKSASKISSSSSTTGPSIQSRQPSSLSRTSRRRGSDTCPKEPRPATSFVSTRVSHSSGLDVTVDDKLPLDVHRLGAYPKYLRSKRPMTAVGKSDKLKSKPFQFHGACAGVRYDTPRKVAKPRDKVLHSMNYSAGCPPCEGHTSNSSGKKIIWDEALDKICQLEAICSRKKERIAQLEAEVALHESALQQRDVDIQKQMECGIERVSTNSKDKINPEEALVDEQKVKELQQQLLNKSNDFLKCQNHIAELKQKLVESNAKVEQQDLTIFELVEKEAERVTELEVMKQLVKDLENLPIKRRWSRYLSQKLHQ
ncbi:uncharacterized protein LOC134210251 isoform X2 [Armigeres subalbatus]|uniref:uncharacterized protein LOC134210251 isoform X2 n=1 Tax=Armigeres subalbatus TaxID=124917 RepID=UPI002ED024D4